jgi:hypothetical protein
MSVIEKNSNSQQKQIKIPEKEITNFLLLVSKLSEIEFLGLVRFFKVEMVKKEKDKEGKSIPKDFYEILADTTEQFCLSSKKKRRDTIKVLKQAVDSSKRKKTNLINKKITEKGVKKGGKENEPSA